MHLYEMVKALLVRLDAHRGHIIHDALRLRPQRILPRSLKQRVVHRERRAHVRSLHLLGDAQAVDEAAACGAEAQREAGEVRGLVVRRVKGVVRLVLPGPVPQGRAAAGAGPGGGGGVLDGDGFGRKQSPCCRFSQLISTIDCDKLTCQ